MRCVDTEILFLNENNTTHNNANINVLLQVFKIHTVYPITHALDFIIFSWFMRCIYPYSSGFQELSMKFQENNRYIPFVLWIQGLFQEILVSKNIKVNPRSWHDDVIKWKHFPCNWPFVRGIHRSPVKSPHKGQWRRALMFSLICAE